MGIFGVDVSNYQASFDFRGWDFAFIKASQGNWFRDGRFAQHLANARANNCLVAAYHYQETSSPESQVALIKEMVPANVPVIIDVEHGSGGVDITRRIVNLLKDEGYDSPFLYLPRWYWQQIGSPSLAGLPTLWASWYPDYVARPREQGIAQVPQSAWSDYGGNKVSVIQFTSTPFDQNYYPGTRDELARLLNGGTGGGGIEDVTDEQLYNVIARVIKDIGNGNAEDLAESLRMALVHYTMPKAPDVEIVKDDSGNAVNSTTIHDEVRWLSANFKALSDKIDSISVGGVDYDLLAEALLSKLDVDLVRRSK